MGKLTTHTAIYCMEDNRENVLSYPEILQPVEDVILEMQSRDILYRYFYSSFT